MSSTLRMGGQRDASPTLGTGDRGTRALPCARGTEVWASREDRGMRESVKALASARADMSSWWRDEPSASSLPLTAPHRTFAPCPQQGAKLGQISHPAWCLPESPRGGSVLTPPQIRVEATSCQHGWLESWLDRPHLGLLQAVRHGLPAGLCCHAEWRLPRRHVPHPPLSSAKPSLLQGSAAAPVGDRNAWPSLDGTLSTGDHCHVWLSPSCSPPPSTCLEQAFPNYLERGQLPS